MIPFDFEYYKPDNVEDAVNLFDKLSTLGKKVIYYGGGTEFISMARMNNFYADAVIDIKGIEECNIFEVKKDKLIIGSGITLTQISEENLFPLLSRTVARIADHTIQDKITIGGNIAGSIIYREAVLPLLLADCKIVIANKQGQKTIPLNDYFNEKLQLKKGEMIVSFLIDNKFLTLPYLHAKRTKNEKIDYPLITLAAILDNEEIKIAFSGLCDYPFRSRNIEEILNEKNRSFEKKMEKIIDNIPGKILTDVSGSAEYRKFMLGLMIKEVLSKFKEG